MPLKKEDYRRNMLPRSAAQQDRNSLPQPDWLKSVEMMSYLPTGVGDAAELALLGNSMRDPQFWEQLGQNPLQPAEQNRYGLPASGYSFQPNQAQMQTAFAAMPLMTAFHGSPHKFDKFKKSAIGTGEGAQAYGHGLYFAESPGVAKSYQATLSSNLPTNIVKANGESVPLTLRVFDAELRDAGVKLGAGDVAGLKGRVDASLRNGMSMDDVVSGYQSSIESASPHLRKGLESQKEAAERLLSNGFSFSKPTGHLYEVDIPDSAIDNMLDWDKPLSEQPEGVRKALRDLGVDEPFAPVQRSDGGWDVLDRDGEPMHISGIYKTEGEAVRARKDFLRGFYGSSGPGTKGYPYEVLSRRLGGQEAASEALRQAGIPGIKYYDGSSRKAGEGTRNFVVFDEDLVKIIDRK